MSEHHDSAARVRAIREQLQHQIEEWERWDADPIAAFDHVAERFYLATGFLAPGKSVPMEMGLPENDIARSNAWAEWNSGRKHERRHLMRAVLAELDALTVRLREVEQELKTLQDLPLARQQVFNDGVPENTEQALRMWHRAAHNKANQADKAEAALARLRQQLDQFARIGTDAKRILSEAREDGGTSIWLDVVERIADALAAAQREE